ncbi:MAG: hypothetical protein K1X88_23635 [Nannocystaceae bacterium]|nr:hypothetical protein [Nannocystaceae bacterium]
MARAANPTATLPPAERLAVRGGSRQGAWTLAGRLVYGACQLGILVAITHLGQPGDIGTFSLALALTAPPMVFANLQLRTLFATDVGDRFAWSTYARLRGLATAAALLVCVGIAAALDAPAASIAVVVALALAKATETSADLQHGVFQRHGRMELFGRSLALRGLGSVGAIAAALALGLPLWLAVTAMAAVWSATLLAFDRPHARRLRARTPAVGSGDGIGALALAGLPLGTVFLLDSLHQNLPRYFVEAELGNAALGLFTPMAYLVTIGSAFAFAVAAPAAPKLARLARAGDGAGVRALVRRMALRTGGLGLAGVAVAALAGGPLVASLYGPAWLHTTPTLVALAIAGTLHFVMVPVMLALTASRALIVQLTCYLAALGGCAIACAAWVPSLGSTGAALGSVAGMACGLLTAVVALLRATRTRGGAT